MSSYARWHMSAKLEDEAPDTLVAAIFAGAGGAAAVALAAGPPLAGALAAAPVVLNAVAQAFLHRSRRRWAIWYEGYKKAADVIDPEVLEAELQANASDPVVQELIVESARAIGEAVADVVIPVMARLTRMYESERRPVDEFFRGMRRVLSDLDSRQFDDLREIVRRALVAPYDPTPPFFVIEAQSWPEEPSRFVVRAVRGRKGQQTTTTSPDDLGQAPRATARVLHLLEANGLAQSLTRTGLSAEVLISSAMVQRIWTVIS
jgi:hypothetical protein